MPTPAIEEFAEQLVASVRDTAVRNCDQLLEPQANSPTAKRWRSAGLSAACGHTVIPDAVDEVVFALLLALDQGAPRMKFVSANGREVDLAEEGLGELAGWYMGSGGWREMFSNERFEDDMEDMAE